MASGSTPLPNSQTHASVAVLPEPDDDVLARGDVLVDQVVDGDHARVVGDAEPGRELRGDVRREVARIDDPAAVRHRVALSGDPGDERAVADVVAAGVQLDLAGTEHPVSQDVGEVGADLGLVGPLVEPSLRACRLLATSAEHGGGDPVERRRLVQAYERIGLQPVTTDTVPTVDEGHLDVGTLDQCIGEGHAHGPCPHDEVVGVDRERHTHDPSTPVHTASITSGPERRGSRVLPPRPEGRARRGRAGGRPRAASRRRCAVARTAREPR